MPSLQELNVSNHLRSQTCMHLLLLECTLHALMTREDYISLTFEENFQISYCMWKKIIPSTSHPKLAQLKVE